jgi:hypothetical protein
MGILPNVPEADIGQAALPCTNLLADHLAA